MPKREAEEHPKPLVVDLDGSLLRSDMLHETLCASATLHWRVVASAVWSLIRDGIAGFKRKLAFATKIDVATLPYNEHVVQFARDWKERGGEVALATATDVGIAQKIAGHFDGLFDVVMGSDGEINLKGEVKATQLVERYGKAGFVYVGDHAADCAVWRQSGGAVTVGASMSLKRTVASLGVETTHLPGAAKRLQAIVAALRPAQWVKNVLVFTPVAASHTLSQEAILPAIWALATFCAAASAIYILNDLMDLRVDRLHPRKKSRPLASGEVSIAQGVLCSASLLVASLSAAAWHSPALAAVILGYAALNVAYSTVLKRYAILDITILAVLYTARIFAGSVATGIIVSPWLLAFSVFIFFSLAAVKRLTELVDARRRQRLRATRRGYRVADTPILAMMALASGYVAALIMALYISRPAISDLYSTPEVLWGICPILLYWISRMTLLAHQGRLPDDPVAFAVKDGNSRICLVLIAGIAVAAALL